MLSLILKNQQFTNPNPYQELIIRSSSNIKQPMFGVSIFSSPEHFMALALSLFSKPQKSVQELQKLLQRTKNPPIAIIYTCQFLKAKSTEECGLDIIRFVSQLSDLSEGFSVSSSLRDVIGESSFLTQVRHNLTHKAMLNQDIILASKSIILKQLEDKYWRPTSQKYCLNFYLDINSIKNIHQSIYGEQIDDKQIQRIQKQQQSISQQWLLKESSPYEFKEFVSAYFRRIIKSKQNSLYQLRIFFKELSDFKRAIALSKMIKMFIADNRNEQLSDILIVLLQIEGINVLKQVLVMQQLRRLAFIHFLGLSRRVISSLDREIQAELAKYWSEKEKISSRNKKQEAQLYIKFDL